MPQNRVTFFVATQSMALSWCVPTAYILGIEDVNLRQGTVAACKGDRTEWLSQQL